MFQKSQKVFDVFMFHAFKKLTKLLQHSEIYLKLTFYNS